MTKRCIKKIQNYFSEESFKKSELGFHKMYSPCTEYRSLPEIPAGNGMPRRGHVAPRGRWTPYRSRARISCTPLCGSLGGKKWGCLLQCGSPTGDGEVLHPTAIDSASPWSQSRTRVKRHQTRAKHLQPLGQFPLLGFPVTKLLISYRLKHLLIFINYL